MVVIAGRIGNRRVQAVVEQIAVGQAGKGVVIGLVFQFGLGLVDQGCDMSVIRFDMRLRGRHSILDEHANIRLNLREAFSRSRVWQCSRKSHRRAHNWLPLRRLLDWLERGRGYSSTACWLDSQYAA
jgi:hypothetical protein